MLFSIESNAFDKAGSAHIDTLFAEQSPSFDAVESRSPVQDKNTLVQKKFRVCWQPLPARCTCCQRKWCSFLYEYYFL